MQLSALEFDPLGRLAQRCGHKSTISFERTSLNGRDLGLLNRAIEATTRFLIVKGLDLIKFRDNAKLLTASNESLFVGLDADLARLMNVRESAAN